MRRRFMGVVKRDAGVEACDEEGVAQGACGPMSVSMPALRAARRTIRLAQRRSLRPPSDCRTNRARRVSIARAVRGG